MDYEKFLPGYNTVKNENNGTKASWIFAIWLLIPILMGIGTLITTWTCQRLSGLETRVEKATIGSDTALSNREQLNNIRIQLDRIEDGNRDLLQRVAKLEAKL